MENNQTNTYMEETNSELVHTYNRFPVVLDHGEGVYLYDTEGKKYLDFAAGIAVCGLGYSNEEYKTALKNQIDLLTHTSNLYYNTTCVKRRTPDIPDGVWLSLARAPGLGPGGRRFESCHPDCNR